MEQFTPKPVPEDIQTQVTTISNKIGSTTMGTTNTTVTGAVKELHDQIATQSVNSYFENISLYYAKRTGNVVQFSGIIASDDMAINVSQASVSIIKTGLRPIGIVVVSLMRGGKSDTVDCVGYVNSDGLLVIFTIGGTTVPSNKSWFISGTYVVN